MIQEKSSFYHNYDCKYYRWKGFYQLPTKLASSENGKFSVLMKWNFRKASFMWGSCKTTSKCTDELAYQPLEESSMWIIISIYRKTVSNCRSSCMKYIKKIVYASDAMKSLHFKNGLISNKLPLYPRLNE